MLARVGGCPDLICFDAVKRNVRAGSHFGIRKRLRGSSRRPDAALSKQLPDDPKFRPRDPG